MTEDAESELLYMYRVIDKAGALYKRGFTSSALRSILKEYHGDSIVDSIIQVIEKENE